MSDEISWRDWRRVDVPGAPVVKVDTRIRKCQVVKDFEGDESLGIDGTDLYIFIDLFIYSFIYLSN